MINCKKISKMVYGGDYNPEQWPEEIWKEDMRMFKLAGIDIVTLNVFSWAEIQPSEDEYNFTKLDKIMDMVRDNGLFVCLATSTGAHPAWMAKRHPDILRTEYGGTKRKFGGRHNSCPNSPTYKKFSVALAVKLAERYKDYENIVAWHISNEFGGECFCDNCENAFRVWLKEKYGTIEEVNRAWNASFWSHTFYDFDEIVLPDSRSEHFDYEKTMFQGISLDYRRFMSDSMLARYIDEYNAIKKITPDIAITTNLMGNYKPLDYQKWAKYMDFVSWDNYPSNEDSYTLSSFRHDLMRGLKQGQPFALMEQTPSVTNWQPYNALKRPGVMRLWSYEAAAHGADTIMFFQMRRSVGACEKYHGAVIDHVGNENTRVFREVAALGEELKNIGDQTLGALSNAKIAIVFDWDNWWAQEYSAGPSYRLKYCDQVLGYYNAVNKLNYDVDIISVEDDVSKYNIVIAPLLYMVKTGYDEKIRKFVKAGGHFVTTFFSGIVNENDLVTTGGYPGKLRDVLGIWVEECDGLPEGSHNEFTYKGVTYNAEIICDLLHEESAKSICGFEKEFYAGMPAITVNDFGKGKAYYVATASDDAFYKTFISDVISEAGVYPVAKADENVEVTSRTNKNGTFIFVLNHNDEAACVTIENDGTDIISGDSIEAGKQTIPAKGVLIIREKSL